MHVQWGSSATTPILSVFVSPYGVDYYSWNPLPFCNTKQLCINYVVCNLVLKLLMSSTWQHTQIIPTDWTDGDFSSEKSDQNFRLWQSQRTRRQAPVNTECLHRGGPFSHLGQSTGPLVFSLGSELAWLSSPKVISTKNLAEVGRPHKVKNLSGNHTQNDLGSKF